MPRVVLPLRPGRRRPRGRVVATDRFTIVFFHAHPDDEALLTGGTMARLSAEGHRVVLVTATAGESGLAAADVTESVTLAELRLAELRDSAAALGCARSVVLGFADSGSDPGTPRPAGAFADTDVDDAARVLADVLIEEAADALTTYDPAGGYGHPDHVQVHRVGARAAQLAGVGLVLEATVDRRLLQRGLRLGRRLAPRSADFDPTRFDRLYADPDQITHRVHVGRYARPKRASMAAHRSQRTSDGDGVRGLDWMLRLPRPLYRLVFGREWYVERGRAVDRPLDDVFDTLRTGVGR